ncbi:unnamed protein product [Hymenolepis diminuta]|uniref:Delta-like protein n=2 Tax=Hymenolepis diminuta TaxID=6216 RepID=A0A564YA69_HYMDI|nr:unnamed protein product [Hymenolepis diminuta]
MTREYSSIYLLLILHSTLAVSVESNPPFPKIHDLFEFHVADMKVTTQGSINFTSCCLPKTWIPPDGCLSRCRILLGAQVLSTAEISTDNSINAPTPANVFRTDVIFSEGKLLNSTRDFRINLLEKVKNPLYLHISLFHLTPIEDTILLARLKPLKIRGHPRKIWTTQNLHSTTDTAPSIRLTLSYRIACPPDYYGEDCERYCAPRDSPLGHYKCDPKDGRIVCLPGWEGSQCTEAICKKGCIHGICESPGVCKCREGWTGETCEECIPFPGCKHGACKFNYSLGYQEPFTCECQTGWSGMLCTIDTQYCSNHPETCLNGGVCHNTATETTPGYTCQCPLGYEGYHCEISNHDCRVYGCNGHGICQTNGSCSCSDAFYGSNCQFNQTACWQNPCQGEKSVCKTLNENPKSSLAINFQCQCQPGLSGMNCENKIRKCDARPCLHGGKCVELADEYEGYQCICLPGHRGRHCELSDSACQHHPCANGGQCVYRANHVECRCLPGWTGPTCRENVNECLKPVCKNGAACRNRPGTYECLCTPGWTGHDCSIPLNTTIIPPPSSSVPIAASPQTVCPTGCNEEDNDEPEHVWPHTSIIIRFAIVSLIIVLICLLILTSLLIFIRKRKDWRHRKSGFEELQRPSIQPPRPNPRYWNGGSIPEPLLICPPSSTTLTRHKPIYGLEKPPRPSGKESFCVEKPPFYNSTLRPRMIMSSTTPTNLIPISGPSVHHAIVYACQTSPPPPYEEFVPHSKVEHGTLKKGLIKS